MAILKKKITAPVQSAPAAPVQKKKTAVKPVQTAPAAPVQTAPAAAPSLFNANGTLTNSGFWIVFWNINFGFVMESFCEFAAVNSDIFMKLRNKEYMQMVYKQIDAIRIRSIERNVPLDQGVSEVKAELAHLFKRLMRDIKRLELTIPDFNK